MQWIFENKTKKCEDILALQVDHKPKVFLQLATSFFLSIKSQWIYVSKMGKSEDSFFLQSGPWAKGIS